MGYESVGVNHVPASRLDTIHAAKSPADPRTFNEPSPFPHLISVEPVIQLNDTPPVEVTNQPALTQSGRLKEVVLIQDSSRGCVLALRLLGEVVPTATGQGIDVAGTHCPVFQIHTQTQEMLTTRKPPFPYGRIVWCALLKRRKTI